MDHNGRNEQHKVDVTGGTNRYLSGSYEVEVPELGTTKESTLIKSDLWTTE